MRRSSVPSRRAFTLMESLLAASILALTVAAITMPFTAAARSDQVAARRMVAVALAQDMLEEILARDLLDDDPDMERSLGPEPGESSRALFDNVDDYNGYSEPAGEIHDGRGGPITEPAAHGLSRRVQVTYVSPPDGTGSPDDFLRVRVEVLHEGVPIVHVSRLIFVLPKE